MTNKIPLEELKKIAITMEIMKFCGEKFKNFTPMEKLIVFEGYAELAEKLLPIYQKYQREENTKREGEHNEKDNISSFDNTHGNRDRRM